MCSFVCMNINECFVHASHCFAVDSDVLFEANICRTFFFLLFHFPIHFFSFYSYCSEWMIRLPFFRKIVKKIFYELRVFWRRQKKVFFLSKIDTHESLWLGLVDNGKLKLTAATWLWSLTGYYLFAYKQ